MRTDAIVYLDADTPVSMSPHEDLAVLRIGDDVTFYFVVDRTPAGPPRRAAHLDACEVFARKILDAVDEARTVDRLLVTLPEVPTS